MRPLAARASRPSAEPDLFAPSSASLPAPSSAPSSASQSNFLVSSSSVSSSSPSSMTLGPVSSPSVVSCVQVAPSSSLSVTAEEKSDSIEHDDDDEDEMLTPVTDSEWGCWAPRPPSADQINDAHDLVVRRTKKVVRRSGSSAGTAQRRKRATSIIRAFLLKPVQLKTGKRKLTHAQQALTFDDAAPWRSVHNRTCLGLHLRRFVGDEVMQDAVMPEVLADTALAMLSNFRRALKHDDEDELSRLHVLIQPAFKSWSENHIYQMYVSCCLSSATLSCVSSRELCGCSFRTLKAEARHREADKQKHQLLLKVLVFGRLISPC